MKEHRLKTINPYFQQVWEGNKKFELRKNDRNYEVGDEVILEEYNSESQKYSGRQIRVIITYLLYEYADVLKEGYIIFSFDIICRGNKEYIY